jgi:hypothetical protein
MQSAKLIRHLVRIKELEISPKFLDQFLISSLLIF